MTHLMVDPVAESVEIVIIGSGFAGLGMAIRLAAAGWADFVVLERAGDVGGTWRDNTYPGAACDIPSDLYSFSFAPNPHWTSAFSSQAEILSYLKDCARRFGVQGKIRFDHEVVSCRWSDASQRWTVTTAHGLISARYVIAGMGSLAEPSVPDLPGLDGFGGESWHSSRWNHDVDLAERSVAVVGTGASAVQIVPELQASVGHLDVYQRTPPWLLPRGDRAFSPRRRRVYGLMPPAQLAVRAATYWRRELLYVSFTSWARHHNPVTGLALTHLAEQVADPDLRARLTPEYSIGCKRILLSDDYYPALGQPNVSLIDGGVRRVTRTGLVADDGIERPADVIVFATGFRATEPAAAEVIWGRDGAWLKDSWSGGMAAYKGTTVAGYPNLFFLVGPNTGLGHNSMVYMIESQINYILDAIATASRREATEIEVRSDVQSAWNDRIQRHLGHTVWTTGGCVSWYLDKHGRNTTLWPGFSFRFRAGLRRFDPDAYHLRTP